MPQEQGPDGQRPQRPQRPCPNCPQGGCDCGPKWEDLDKKLDELEDLIKKQNGDHDHSELEKDLDELKDLLEKYDSDNLKQRLDDLQKKLDEHKHNHDNKEHEHSDLAEKIKENSDKINQIPHIMSQVLEKWFLENKDKYQTEIEIGKTDNIDAKVKKEGNKFTLDFSVPKTDIPVDGISHIILVADQTASYWPGLKRDFEDARGYYSNMRIKAPPTDQAWALPALVAYKHGSAIKVEQGLRNVSKTLNLISRGEFSLEKR